MSALPSNREPKNRHGATLTISGRRSRSPETRGKISGARDGKSRRRESGRKKELKDTRGGKNESRG